MILKQVMSDFEKNNGPNELHIKIMTWIRIKKIINTN